MRTLRSDHQDSEDARRFGPEIRCPPDSRSGRGTGGRGPGEGSELGNGSSSARTWASRPRRPGRRTPGRLDAHGSQSICPWLLVRGHRRVPPHEMVPGSTNRKWHGKWHASVRGSRSRDTGGPLAKRPPSQVLTLRGRRDSNPRPSPWQGNGNRPPTPLQSAEQAPVRRLVRPVRRSRLLSGPDSSNTLNSLRVQGTNLPRPGQLVGGTDLTFADSEYRADAVPPFAGRVRHPPFATEQYRVPSTQAFWGRRSEVNGLPAAE